MNHFSFLNSPAVQAIGYTLLYSLWQSFIVFICLKLILRCIKNASSRIKYAISWFAHIGIAAWFVITFVRQLSIRQSEYLSAQLIPHGIFHQPLADQSVAVTGGFSLSFLSNYFPFLATIYLIGVLWLSVRLMLNYFQTIEFRINGLSDLDAEWMDHIWNLADKMQIHQPVYAYISKYVTTPMMVGFFRPVILLPLAAVNNLSPDQIEAILLHELAHIRRNDYLLNLVQSVMDTILFFNPFAWWISKNIREEREKCCDEVVLKLSDPYPYARALLALEEFGHNNHTLVMAAVNQRSQLLHRIKNIMEMKHKPINLRQKLIALAIVISATISVAWLTPNEKKANSKSEELKNAYKTLFAVDKKMGTFNFPGNNKLLQSIPDSNHPEVVPPLPPPPPPVPPVTPDMKLPPAPPAPPVPPVPPVAPEPPSISMNGYKDSIPSIGKYFQSDAWKKEQAEIEKSGKKMQQYFQSDAWKKQMQDIQKSTASIQQYFNSPEWKKSQEDIQKNADKMQQYFKSDAWKKQQEEIQKSANGIQKYFNSPEWKKSQQDIQKNAEKIQQYFKSDAWKKQQEEIQKSANGIQKYFNSPEWKKQQEDIKKNAEKMQQYFKSDEWKNQQKEFRHMTDSAKAFFKSDLWKKQQESVQDVMVRTKKLIQSDEWKKQLIDPITIELKTTLNNLIEIQNDHSQ